MLAAKGFLAKDLTLLQNQIRLGAGFYHETEKNSPEITVDCEGVAAAGLLRTADWLTEIIIDVVAIIINKLT